MDAYEKIKLARSTSRPTAIDYIKAIITDFTELHGDRAFADDRAIVGGVGYLKGMPVTVIGIEKGHTMDEKKLRNFGCVLPEGYRKAQRLIFEAEKFRRPVICFVDTQGANPGIGAEERGAGHAIAHNLQELINVKTPIISVMIGEGGSGGALALAVADKVWMLENAYYSVVSPEACAQILYKDSAVENIRKAAEALKLFSTNLYDMEIIEKIIPEPKEFSVDANLTDFMEDLGSALFKELKHLGRKSDRRLLADRYEKYRKIGRQSEI